MSAIFRFAKEKKKKKDRARLSCARDRNPPVQKGALPLKHAYGRRRRGRAPLPQQNRVGKCHGVFTSSRAVQRYWGDALRPER